MKTRAQVLGMLLFALILLILLTYTLDEHGTWGAGEEKGEGRR